MAKWCYCQGKTKELRYGILKSHQGGITSVNFNITLHTLKCAIFGISNLEISFYTLSFMSFRTYWIILLSELIPAAAKSLQSCPTLCDPIDGSPPGSPIPGTLQARTLEWVAIAFSNAWKWKVKGKSLSRVRLSDPMDCSLPGSSIHGILQARVLEWGAIAFSRTDS